MPQYLSPGVYVEEVPSAVKPIAGVSTSTACFIGIFDAIRIPRENPKYDPTKEVNDNNQPSLVDEFKFINKPEERAQALKDASAALKTASDDLAAKKKALAENKEEKRTEELSTAVADAEGPRASAERRRAFVETHAEADTPVLCTNFTDFTRSFGGFSIPPAPPAQAAPTPASPAGSAPTTLLSTANVLAHAVYGFFNNGGTRCYVVRYASEADLSADAFSHLEAIDEIALVAAPGITVPAVQQMVVDHCTKMQDRFAILDVPQKPKILTVDGINSAPVRNTDFAAIYFPWIKVFDLPTKLQDPKGDGEIAVPPSGHIAGIYARVDNERGVHKAPANEVVRGALSVEYQISKAIQDGLNPSGVNCIREMNNRIVVWGARTVGGDFNTDLKYINVRRTLLFLRESIDEGTQWVVFEPNDRTLWAKIVRNVTAFLTTVWRAGALFGSTPAEAFYVKCDDETNPPEERDLGRVTTEIGVAIVKPAEFVIFRISQWAGPQGK